MLRKQWRGCVAAAGLAALVGCGGGGETPLPDDWKPLEGHLVGAEGVTYSAGDSSTGGPAIGRTNVNGTFPFKVKPSSATQSCNDSGIPNTNDACLSPTTLGVCGVTFGSFLVPPANGFGIAPMYTPLDFSSNPIVVNNIASILLMSNANNGDPNTSGLKVSEKLQGATCPAVDLTSTNIETAAAAMQTTAQGDGMPHPWPDAQQIASYVTEKYICAHSGLYDGWQANTATAAYPAGALAGRLTALIDVTGHVSGTIDFSRKSAGPYTGIVPFAGSLTIAPGGGTFAYTTPPTSSIPGLILNISLTPNSALGTWQSSDGGAAGTTAFLDWLHGNVTNPGLHRSDTVAIPRYRFIIEGLSYVPPAGSPGGGLPLTFALQVDIDVYGQAKAMLMQWPVPEDPAQWALFFLSGNLSGGVLTLSYNWDREVTSTAVTDKQMKFTLDTNASTLMGDFVGYDGTPIGTLTIPGCRD